MNEKYINEALDRVDSRHIDEALSYRRPRLNIRAYIAAAAAAAVVIGVGVFALTRRGETTPEMFEGGSSSFITAGVAGSSKQIKTVTPQNIPDRIIYCSAEEIVKDCPLIVVGEYTGDVGTVPSELYGSDTVGILRVEKVLKGECDETLDLRLHYTKTDEDEISVTYACSEDIAPLQPGTRAIFCLTEPEDGSCYISGAYSGIYSLGDKPEAVYTEPGAYNKEIAEGLKKHYGIEQ